MLFAASALAAATLAPFVMLSSVAATPAPFAMLSSIATTPAPIVMRSSAAATPAPKPIDLVHASAIASSSASSILAQLSAEAAKIESDFEGEAAGVCDVYGKGQWIDDFQAQVAADLGKEAGLFVPTGVCAQQAALSVYAGLPLASRSLLRPSFITHATSHLLVAEEDAYSDLLGITAIKAGNDGRPLTAADVEVELKRLAAVGLTPCCIVIEMPWRELGCRATPWDELLTLRKLADKCGTNPAVPTATPCAGGCNPMHPDCNPGPGCTCPGNSPVCSRYGTPLHMDGARLLEIAPWYGRDPAEIAALFDSVDLSFYKGFGLGLGLMGNLTQTLTLTLTLTRSTSPSTRGLAG